MNLTVSFYRSSERRTTGYNVDNFSSQPPIEKEEKKKVKKRKEEGTFIQILEAFVNSLIILLVSSSLWAQSQTAPAATVNNTNLPGTSVTDIMIENAMIQKVKALTSGKPTITGTPTYQNGVKFSNTTGSALTFQDGTTQNTAARALNIAVASGTVSNTTTAQTTFQVCQGTVTMQTNGHSVVVQFAGATVNASAGGRLVYLSVEQDGGFIAPLDATHSITAVTPAAATGCEDSSFSWTFFKPSAAVHSWCLTIRDDVNGGNSSVCNGTVGNGVYTNQLTASELGD